ncbi:MBL fold metallo-hydrolase [Actinospica sp.]|jgi:glyoxylase-like metal-dependent hydrolase (beta-lactamase superfamily II)/rhodanese-related sulfurtransferase|uniref:MBL fold metallo-hydrolase n=1 Tax=Actinospica sp. TaxID=1872142 RepID=UPI002BAA7A3C|nr:MBL fold metallo-hydrolase [Actinospica sp.]HWG28871.1 MBL fold metallo-hydrolase [Actinospica sp.]
MSIEIVVVQTPELGDRSYLIHDGTVAAVIDPQRDIDRVIAAAKDAGVRIGCVAETHIHNDYVSGGYALAELLDVPYLVAEAEHVSFDRFPVADGTEIAVGDDFHLRAIATPGHTPHHMSYVAVDAGRPVAVATGGSLLFGTTGRTDLSGPERTVDLTQRQFHSARKLGRLPADVAVLPTHGFGSFCSGGAPTSAGSSTIGVEHRENLAMRAVDEYEFTELLLADLIDYPTYYRHMAELNLAGASASDLSAPSSCDGPGLRTAIEDGVWVLDLRSRVAHAAGHLAGSIGVEYGPSFTSYLGWVIPRHTPVILLSDQEDPALRAQRDLTRIGIDRPAGRHLGPLADIPGAPETVHYPVRRFADLPDPRIDDDTMVLDVRRDDEWKAGHLPGATHLPLPDVLDHAHELPNRRLWVHCAAGYRASIAASLLHRAGHRVVLINDDMLNAPF